MKLLLDENLSPRLVSRLAAMGIPASHVAHLGRGGLTDTELWQYAFAIDAVVATINARDFLLLARNVELHPGLIVLRRSGLSPDKQWRQLEPAVRYCLEQEAAGRSLVNLVLAVVDIDELEIYELPGTTSR